MNFAMTEKGASSTASITKRPPVTSPSTPYPKRRVSIFGSPSRMASSSSKPKEISTPFTSPQRLMVPSQKTTPSSSDTFNKEREDEIIIEGSRSHNIDNDHKGKKSSKKR